MKKNLNKLYFACVEAKHLRFSVYGISQQCHFYRYKRAVMDEFCGEDYKRTLETKLLMIKCTRESDILLFSLETRKFIQQLYSIGDDKTIELIASNHVVADLESSLRETVKICSNTRLESLLELT